MICPDCGHTILLHRNHGCTVSSCKCPIGYFDRIGKIEGNRLVLTRDDR